MSTLSLLLRFRKVLVAYVSHHDPRWMSYDHMRDAALWYNGCDNMEGFATSAQLLSDLRTWSVKQMDAEFRLLFCESSFIKSAMKSALHTMANKYCGAE